MPRYIDADAYIKNNECCGYLDEISVKKFNEITPTADVVEVVRCKNCCMADIRCEGLYCFCTLHEEYRTLDYFCASAGERDEEDIEMTKGN